MFKLTYIRHGETDYNANGLFQGQSDIPLNDLGKKQADLAGLYMKDIKFDKIYSSDLSRCVQTTDMIIKRNAQSPPEMVTDSRLREKSFGDFEGKPFHEFHDWRRQNRMKHSDDNIPGGETEEQVITRLESFLDHLFSEMSTMTLSRYEPDIGHSDFPDRSANSEASTGSSSSKVSTRSSDSTAEDSLSFLDLGYPEGSEEAPHVLISSHGMFLRIMIRHIHRKYRCTMSKGLSVKHKSPNTGLSGFVFRMVSGRPRTVDVKFLFTDYHLCDLTDDEEDV